MPAPDYSFDEITDIANRFAVPGPAAVADFPEKGNIHLHTYQVTDSEGRLYLLQSINQQVFTRPHATMAAMMAAIAAQRDYLARHPLPPGDEWEPITLISTRAGEPYLTLEDHRGSSVWRLMEMIPGCRTFKSLGEIPDPGQRLRVAEETGRGLARYITYTSGMDTSGLESPLPGYHDTGLYYNIFQSILNGSRTLSDARPLLPRDDSLRQSTEQHFLVHLPEDEYRRRMEDEEVQECVRALLAEREFCLKLQREVKSGRIRRTAIHGDTKIDNFLFSSRTHRVKALVDLDTIMPLTWLVDWGDTLRSLANVAGEKEPDLSRIVVNEEIYEAIARGFLSAATDITPAERAMLVEAVQIMTLELAVRFLTDYLRGDTYFKLAPTDPPELNRTRALVQYTLFQRFRDHAPTARRIIDSLVLQ